ncbi:GldG family protein [Salinispira pacifica]|uniref:Uncharacterized protein n=1 Tax=Salinispira pacifica TaxID=1307761 RepID=V5WHD0_9SPIO|nr:Gldg family protein [Salinispira pacifica]AHC15005.1 hypothetical protein L21SP2_1620 [Salinispira pacifica]
MMRYRNYLSISIILTLVIFILLALIFQQFYLRLDLSRDRVFSISAYSRNLLENLEDRLDVTYYLSPGLASRVPEIQEVHDLLNEFQRVSRGKLQVTVINPEDIDDGKEARPEDFGIVPRELQIVEGSEQTYATVYSGIVLKYRDAMEVIPLALNSSGLEYELSSRVVALGNDRKPSLGIVSGGTHASHRDYQTLIQFLGQYYNLQLYSPGDALPPSIDALAVLGYAGLDQGDLYAIEQLILRGKGVIIAAEGTAVHVDENLALEDVSDHPMLDMLQSYGIRIEPGWVFDSQNMEIPVQRQEGRAVVNRYEEYPPWLRLSASQVHPSHPVTSRFQALDLFWASPLTITGSELPGTGTAGSQNPGSQNPGEAQISVLLRSSPDSVYVSDPQSDPASAAALMTQAENRRGEYVLAAELSGSLTSHFTVLPDILRQRAVNYPRALSSADDVNLIVIGDSDFPGELYQTGGSSYNIIFMQNLVEYLLGDEELMKLRTRGGRNGRLDAPSSPLERRRILDLAYFTGMFAAPGIVILYGLLRVFRRRRMARRAPYFPESSDPGRGEN